MPSTLLISPVVLAANTLGAAERYGGTPVENDFDPNPAGTWFIFQGVTQSILTPPTIIASNSSPGGWSVTPGSPGGPRRWVADGVPSSGNPPWAWDEYFLNISVVPPSGWDANSGFNVAVMVPFQAYSVDGSGPVSTPPANWWEVPLGYAVNWYEATFGVLFSSYFIVGAGPVEHTTAKRVPVDFVCRNILDPAPYLLPSPSGFSVGLSGHPGAFDATRTKLYDGSNGSGFYTAYDDNDYPANVVTTTFEINREDTTVRSNTLSINMEYDDGLSDFVMIGGLQQEPTVRHEYVTCHSVGAYAYANSSARGFFIPRLTLKDNYGREAVFEDYTGLDDPLQRVFTVTNQTPVAEAMLCSSNPDGTTHLDGTESSDADNDVLTYEWYVRRYAALPWSGVRSYVPWADAVIYEGDVWLRTGPPFFSPDTIPEEGASWFRLTENNAAALDTTTFVYRDHGAFTPVDTLLATGVTADVSPPDEEGDDPPIYVYALLLKVTDNDGAFDWDWACHYFADPGHPISALTEPLGPIYAAMQVGSDIQVIREPGGGYTTRENLALLENYKHPTIYRSGDSSRLYVLARNSDAVWDLFYSDDSGATFTLMAQPFGGDASYKKVRGGHGFAEGGGAATAIKGGTVWYVHSWDNVNWSEPVDTEIISDIAADVHQQSEAGSARLVIFAQNATYYSLTADGLPLPNGDSAWVELV